MMYEFQDGRVTLRIAVIMIQDIYRHHMRSILTMLFFETYESADKAMNQLRDIIKTHGFTTISDLKNLSGAYCDYLIDSRYGWTNLNDAEIVRVRGGDYSIRLPRAMAVN